MGILLITHDLCLVARHADRVCVMQQGQLVESGEVLSTLTSPAHAYTKRLLAASVTSIPAISPRPEQKPLLKLCAISKSYALSRNCPFSPAKKYPVLHPMNLTNNQGEIVGLIGESGSGKTTLGSAAIGLIEANLFSGRTVTRA